MIGRAAGFATRWELYWSGNLQNAEQGYTTGTRPEEDSLTAGVPGRTVGNAHHHALGGCGAAGDKRRSTHATR